jgi:hypothetical protein
MKTNRMFLILFFLLTLLSIDLMGMQPVDNKPNRPRPGSVGAPLDGGLLVVLGAAGYAYYLTRKKKKINNLEK